MAKTIDSTADTQIPTDRRAGNDRRQQDQPVAKERRKVQRRRQIDPTTCERDYSNDEIEFMRALDDYKRANGRMFPTCSEILEVVRKLGYIKDDYVEFELVTVNEQEAETDLANDDQFDVIDGE